MMLENKKKIICNTIVAHSTMYVQTCNYKVNYCSKYSLNQVTNICKSARLYVLQNTIYALKLNINNNTKYHKWLVLPRQMILICSH